MGRKLDIVVPGPVALVSDLFVTARPRQWLKNAVVLAPLVFGRRLLEPDALLDGLLAAAAFCAAGSAVYFFNDWRDAAADREHPLKRQRPIAAGRLEAWQVWGAIAVLACVALWLAWLAGGGAVYVVAGYGALMVLYTMYVKHVALLDVFTIAGGFVLRVWAGATEVDVPLSPWLYLCTVLLALFLAVAKRRHEVLLLEGVAGNHRRALDEYPVPLLDALLQVSATATIMAYSLYTFSAANLPPGHRMMLTVPFVLYGVFRYLFLVYRKDLGGMPEQVLLNDRAL
ncbi:MAG: decaprenyl-phosphate phosphoribosyltransferase, partial [Thermomicrobium sp.]|nr:decaprenyl-phosphate phosphoribosyltransferase [Thermomicrobium sp.]